MFTKEDLQEFLENLLGMIRWLIVAGITGVLVGLVGVLFGKGMTFVNGCRAAHPWIIWLLPVGGVAIIGLYHLFHVYNPRGTNLVLEAIHAKEEVPLYMAPLIIVSTLITHLVGGSAGREGAALQLGGSIGEQLGRWFRFDDKDRGLMVMCGMSAAFSALFGTPLAAAVFPMEVASVGIMHYAALVPCVCASIVASRLALYFGMQPEAFPVLEVPEFTGTTAGAAVLLGILCAIISIVFCVMLHQVGAQFKKFSNPYVKAAVGGVIILAITLLLGTQDYSSAGIPLIERALEGEVRPEAFLLKMILTAITLGCGFKVERSCRPSAWAPPSVPCSDRCWGCLRRCTVRQAWRRCSAASPTARSPRCLSALKCLASRVCSITPSPCPSAICCPAITACITIRRSCILR